MGSGLFYKRARSRSAIVADSFAGGARRMAQKLSVHRRYCLELPGFLKQPLSLAQCRAKIRAGVEGRNANFLALIKHGISFYPQSPYSRLFRFAGCEFGDLEKLVHRDGVEETLQRLSSAGVYITIEEYKGLRPVQRGTLCFDVKPEEFDNPSISPALELASGGTRGRGITTLLCWGFLGDEAAAEGVVLDALGFYGSPWALWHDIVKRFLTLTKGAQPVLKWFFPVSTSRNRMAAYYAVLTGRLLGHPLPWPEATGPPQTRNVADWLAQKKQEARRTVLNTSPSNAIRVSRAAQEHGIDISGMHILTGGEPLTVAREREIRASGLTVSTQYAAMETGYIGLGCGSSGADDVHLLRSKLAIIQVARSVGSAKVSVDGLRVTTLLPTTPKIFINMENGDYGRLQSRSCGCQLDAFGLTEHLSHIRSFEKLTTEGMTFFAADLGRIIEEVLPRKFGGCPLHYQAIEEEDENGAGRLTLLASPALGVVNDELLTKTIYEELKKGGKNSQRMANAWKAAGTVQVKREEPKPTRGGKVFPFQVR